MRLSPLDGMHGLLSWEILRRKLRSKVRLRYVVQTRTQPGQNALKLPFAAEQAILADLIPEPGARNPSPVHCHLVDIPAFDTATVEALNRARLPFAVILGGPGDPNLGAALARSGAFWMVDNHVEGFADKVLAWLVRVVVLGLVSKQAFASDQVPMGCLATRPILTLEEWMEACFLSRRRLEQLCSRWSGLPPARTLQVCQALKLILAHGPEGRIPEAFFGDAELHACIRSYRITARSGIDWDRLPGCAVS